MNKFSNILSQAKAKMAKAVKNEEGFSLLELVIAVGILLLLTVGGIIGYNSITENAKKAAVTSAADQVYTAAKIAEADGDSSTTNTTVETEYNNTSDGVQVSVSGEGTALSVRAYLVDEDGEIDEADGGWTVTKPAPTVVP